MGDSEFSNNTLEEEEEQKLLRPPHPPRDNQIRNILGYFVVLEALFQARQSALAEKFEKKNEARDFCGFSFYGEKFDCPKSHSQHLKSEGDTMHGREESQKLVFDPIGIKNLLFNDLEYGYFMEYFDLLDDLVRLLTFFGLKVWSGKKCCHFKSSEPVKKEKVDESENMLYTVIVTSDDEEEYGELFDNTRWYRRRRDIGWATMQSKQSYVKMAALRKMNREGVEAMRTKIRTKKKNNSRKLPKKALFHC